MNPKLDKYEQEIEDNALQYKPASDPKKSQVEAIIDKANEKKSISLRLKINDLEQLKRKADIEEKNRGHNTYFDFLLKCRV